MRIGLDIDDVLFPWTELAHAACIKKGITNGKQVTQWGMHLDYGCERDVLWGVVNHAYIAGMLRRPPYEGVVETLAALQEAGHGLHLATARGFEGRLAEFVRKETVIWLQMHAIPHDSLTFTKDKTVLDVDVFLDDGIHNVEALHDYGRVAFLRDQPHNQSATHLNPWRVRDLQHFTQVYAGHLTAA